MLRISRRYFPIFALLLFVSLTAFSVNAYSDDEEPLYEYNGFIYGFDPYEYNSATIRGCNQNLTHLVIPSIIESDNWTLSVTGISGYDAWPEEMTSLEIPETVIHIEGNLWQNCDLLEAITVASGNPIFESVDGCLYNKMNKSLVCCPNQIESIEIKEGTLKIENMALGQRQNLKYVRIPESLTIIDGDPVYDNTPFLSGKVSESELVFEVSPQNSCFAVYDEALYDIRAHKLIYCRPNRVTVEFPADLRIIPDYAFWDTSLRYVDLPDGLQYIGQGAFSHTGLQNIVIPDSVVYVGSGAFEDCYSLCSAKLSSSMETINEKVFSGCPILHLVRIPASIKSIGLTAFENNVWSMIGIVDPGSYGEEYCTGWKEFETDEEHFVYYDGTDIIDSGKLGNNCEWTLDIAGKLTITGIGEIQPDPDSNDDDPYYSLPECSTVEIKKGITNIPGRIFSHAVWLELYKVEIPDTVTYIDKEAFYNCSFLDTVNIPDSVTEIGERAFAGCSSLEKLVIPESVVRIGDGAFAGCDKLELILPDEARFDREKLFSW